MSRDYQCVSIGQFSYPVPALKANEVGTGREIYHRAALLGSSANGRPNVCQRHFPTCGHTSKQLIDIFLNNEDVDNNEVPLGRPIHTPHVSPVRQPFNLPQRQPQTLARPQHQQQPHVQQHHHVQQQLRQQQQQQQQQQQRQHFAVGAPAAA